MQSVVNDTNVTGSIAAQALTLNWSGTLAAGRLNANVVQAITNDTNVTGSITAQNLTIAWSGTLSTARGGTGVGSYIAGDMLYYAAGSAFSKLGIGAANDVLTSSGTAPQWSTALDLSGGATFGLGVVVSSGGITVTGNSTITGTLGGITTLTATTLGGTLSTASQPNVTTMAGLTSAAALATVGTITAGVWNGSDVTTVYGGTGLSSYSAGDVLYFASGTAFNKLGIGAANTVMTSTGSAPQWSNSLTLGGSLAVGTTLNVTGLTTLAATTVTATLSHTNASPFSMTNGQVVTVALTAQTVGAATLTIPNFANVNDTFAFLTLAQTFTNKTLSGATLSGTMAGTPTWASNQAITLSTAAQPNVTSVARSHRCTFGHRHFDSTAQVAGQLTGYNPGIGFSVYRRPRRARNMRSLETSLAIWRSVLNAPRVAASSRVRRGTLGC